MWKQKFCLNLKGESTTGLNVSEQIKILKKVGFDGFFADWSSPGSCDVAAQAGQNEEMIFQSIHAPFKRAADMWKEDEEKGNEAVEELIQCVQDCGKLKVPIMIVHTYIGFEETNPNPPVIGLKRYEKVVEAAKA